MRYSVTGAINADSMEVVYEALSNLDPEPTHFYTGGAFGVDTYAALAALRLFPWAAHYLILPVGLEHNRDLALTPDFKVGYVYGDYMNRNDALVEACETLLAFPRTGEEVLRSGTWATIRRARTAGKRIQAYPLNGDPTWIEYGN